MWESEEQCMAREARQREFLVARGFTPVDHARYSKNGQVYDMSAADLTQLDRIEREGLFVVRH